GNAAISSSQNFSHAAESLAFALASASCLRVAVYFWSSILRKPMKLAHAALNLSNSLPDSSAGGSSTLPGPETTNWSSCLVISSMVNASHSTYLLGLPNPEMTYTVPPAACCTAASFENTPMRVVSSASAPLG